MGLEVRSFPSAQDFLDGAAPEAPGCLLLDVRMPGMCGLDLQNELANAELSLPIIFITGHGTVPMSVQAMKAGAVDFLQKPFAEQDLLNAFHQAIEQDQSFGYVLFFMDEESLGYLDQSDGWELGTGPSLVVLDQGFAKSLSTTTLQKGVYAFIFNQKGLMGGIGIQGSKITKITPDK